MVAALQWVRQNIAAFGGDPTRVLVFCQSAGSYDIQVLLASPAAQGLFSAAAMESNVIPGGQLRSGSCKVGILQGHSIGPIIGKRKLLPRPGSSRCAALRGMR